MALQADLFEQYAKPWSPEDDHEGWQQHFLADMEKAPIVACYPGFTGAMCERLVAKGLATKEPAGFLDPPAGLTPRQLKAWGWKAEDHAQFRYARTP